MHFSGKKKRHDGFVKGFLRSLLGYFAAILHAPPGMAKKAF